jgi:hypothetical protein
VRSHHQSISVSVHQTALHASLRCAWLSYVWNVEMYGVVLRGKKVFDWGESFDGENRLGGSLAEALSGFWARLAPLTFTLRTHTA